MYRKMYFSQIVPANTIRPCSTQSGDHSGQWRNSNQRCVVVTVLQCLWRERALPAAVGGSLPAAWLPGPGRPRATQPGVPAHPPPDAAAAPGQGGATGGGLKGQLLLLSARVPPRGRWLHLRPAISPAATVAEDEELILIGQFNPPNGRDLLQPTKLLFIYSPSHLFKCVNIGSMFIYYTFFIIITIILLLTWLLLMVKIFPISQHLNEENKNISKAAKCLHMFICHLQRHDSPSVVVTVKNSTNAAVAAAGHVVAIRGWGFGSAELRPDRTRSCWGDWDFDKVCPVGGAISVAEGVFKIALLFFSSSQKVASLFCPLGPTIWCAYTQKLTRTHSQTQTHARALGRRRMSRPFVKNVHPQRLGFRRRKEWRRGGTIGSTLLGPSLSWVTSCRPEVTRSPYGIWVKLNQCCEEPIRTPGSQISNVVSTY